MMHSAQETWRKEILEGQFVQDYIQKQVARLSEEPAKVQSCKLKEKDAITILTKMFQYPAHQATILLALACVHEDEWIGDGPARVRMSIGSHYSTWYEIRTA